jgi:hypothetical protein
MTNPVKFESRRAQNYLLFVFLNDAGCFLVLVDSLVDIPFLDSTLAPRFQRGKRGIFWPTSKAVTKEQQKRPSLDYTSRLAY